MSPGRELGRSSWERNSSGQSWWVVRSYRKPQHVERSLLRNNLVLRWLLNWGNLVEQSSQHGSVLPGVVASNSARHRSAQSNCLQPVYLVHRPKRMKSEGSNLAPSNSGLGRRALRGSLVRNSVRRS